MFYDKRMYFCKHKDFNFAHISLGVIFIREQILDFMGVRGVENNSQDQASQ